MIARPAILAAGLLTATLFGWSPVPPAPARGADDPPERKVVVVAPAVLDAYVGRYELTPRLKLTLRRHRGHLFAQLSNQPPFEVYPETETTFYWKIVAAKFTVEKDAAGAVTGVLFEQGGIKLKGKRITDAPPEGEPEEDIDSPRLTALAKAVKGGDTAAVGKFWEELRDKAPLVEPVPKDARHSWVTYTWRGTDTTRRVTLGGGMPNGGEQKPLARLAGTDVWYLTEKVPNDARLTYNFVVNGPVRVPAGLAGQLKSIDRSPPTPDPENPRLFWTDSVVELPGAPKQPWTERRPGVTRGKLTSHKVKSESLKQERSFTVYTPPGYDPKGDPCGLLVLFDGPDYQDAEMIPGPVILDNLIADKKIPPLVAVFVKHASRMKELACSEPFADYLAKELVPWVRENYRVSPRPDRTTVGGLSLGGLMASFCGLRHPDVFGNVLSQSGSYQWSPGLIEAELAGTPPPDVEPGELTRRFLDVPRREVRFYLEAGRFEDGIGGSLVAENRRFRDVLRAKGYSVRYAEFTGGHAHLNWRGTLADGLVALTGPPEQK